MKAQITIVDKNGQKRTWLFRPWSEMGGKFKHGDKIKILFNDATIADGIYRDVDNEYNRICILQDVDGCKNLPIAYSFESIMGFNKPKD